MHVGICTIQLRLPENGSLKGKRSVVRSLTARVWSRFNVSIAEVEDNEKWQLLTLGVCWVSNDAQHANEMLSRVVDYVLGMRGDVELLDYSLEVIRGE